MRTLFSNNNSFPDGTTIYEKILLAKLESLYFKKEREDLLNLERKFSSKDFLIPLKEFNLDYKQQQIQNLIKNVFFNMRNDGPIEKFYQVMAELFTENQIMRLLCRVILYWQMVLLSSSFDTENYISQIINDKIEQRNDLIVVFLAFIESNLNFINIQQKKPPMEFRIDEYPRDTLYLIGVNAEYQILHHTELPLPKTFYSNGEQLANKHTLTKDDLVPRQSNKNNRNPNYGSNDGNEERKYNQGNVPQTSVDQPIKKIDPVLQFVSTLTQFNEKYSSELDLRSKATFAELSKKLKSDMILALNGLPVDDLAKEALQRTFTELAGGVETIKTHIAHQSSPRGTCDICGEKEKDGLFYSMECNWNYEFVPAFCTKCFEILLRARFYMDLGKPYLTMDCFDKEKCPRRLIFTEDSLMKIFTNIQNFHEFLTRYNKLRDKCGRCFSASCKTKFTGNMTDDETICLECLKCKKFTCKVCWEEFHAGLLCRHLQEEYNAAAVLNLMKKIIVCPICYSITRNTLDDQVDNTIKCEGCHRLLCDTCYQSYDATNFHGPVIHDIICPKYKNKRFNDPKDKCEICEVKGYNCKEIDYFRFLGFKN